jgi:hypothetical protein
MAGLWVVGVPRIGRGVQLEDHPMAKSHSIDEPRREAAVEPTRRKRRLGAKKRSAAPKATKRQIRRKPIIAARSRTKSATSKQTKQQICLDLLSRTEGATIEELQGATGWQQHSVRGFLAGAVKKKLGLTLLSEKPNAGPRRYHIASAV